MRRNGRESLARCSARPRQRCVSDRPWLDRADLQEDDEKPSWDDMEDDGYGQEVDEMVDDLDMGQPSGDFAYEDVPFEDEDDKGPVNMVRLAISSCVRQC